MGITLTYAGVNLTAAPYNLIVHDVARPALAAPRLSSKTLGMRDGAFLVSGGIEPQTITCAVSVMQTTRAAVTACVDALLYLLDTVGEQTLAVSLWPDRFWYVLPSAEITRELSGECLETFTLTFLAANPNAYASGDETELNFDLTATSSPQVFTVADDDLALGTAPALPKYEIHLTGYGGITYIKIENATLGTFVQWYGTLAAGSRFRVDAKLKTCYYSTDGTTWYFAARTLSNEYPVLIPRIDNTLKVTCNAVGTFDVTYRERYRS